MRRARAIAALMACAAAATGCGSTGSDATGSTSLTVYASLPLQGPGAADARSVLNAEKLALIEAGGRVGELTVRLVALDDSTAQRKGWDPGTTAANAIGLYEVTEFAPEMKDMTAIIVDAARVTAEALPLLRDIGANGGRLHELTERLVRMEGHADDIHAAGLKRAFETHKANDAMAFIVQREVFKHLERIVDAFEDVANQIDAIVIDHS